MAALAAIAFLVPNLFFEPAADTLLREEFTVGSFRSATRLTVGTQGWIYVVDSHENAVFVNPPGDRKEHSVGGFGWAATSFDNPSGIATDGLNVYVSDRNNHRIQRFDRTVNYLSSFSTRDTSLVAAQFGFPAGVALSRFGDLFILDSENIRVMKFTAQLRYERSFGGIDAERGRLRQPIKIVVAPNDHVVVLERGRLVEFDYFGNLLRVMGEGMFSGAQGFDIADDGIVVATSDSLLWFSPAGQLVSTTAASTIISSVSLVPLQDVALAGDRVYLLTQRQVVVLKKLLR